MWIGLGLVEIFFVFGEGTLGLGLGLEWVRVRVRVRVRFHLIVPASHYPTRRALNAKKQQTAHQPPGLFSCRHDGGS